MPRKMALGGAGLAEDWAPSARPPNRVATQVRVEMRAIGACDTSARQALDDRRDSRSVERNVAVRGRRSIVRNRERAEQVVAENWARTSAMRTVESLAAEYQLRRRYPLLDENYRVVAASAGVAGVFASAGVPAGVRSRGPVLAPIDMNIIPCS